jgi:hypothetical protein
LTGERTVSNAWFFYLTPLSIFTAFTVIGVVCFCLFLWSLWRAGGKRTWDFLVAALFGLAVGGPLEIRFLLTSPTPGERQILLDKIFRTPPERIERFIIKAARPHNEQYKPLTPTEVVIDDPARIRRIAEILAAAPEWSANHPRSRWTADVVMVTRDGTYYFGVSAPVPGDRNGTLVGPWVNEAGGWNLGDVRANGLDEVLEEAVKK